MCVDKSPGSLFPSIDLCVCVFGPRAHCLHYCGSVTEFDIRKDDASDFSVKVTAASWVSCGFTEILECLSSLSVKDATGVLMGIALSL